MTAISKTQIKKDAEAISRLITDGMEAWVTAGKMIATGVDEDPKYIDKLCSHLPDLSPEHLKRLEDIGRKRIHPQILVSAAPGIRRLGRLDYSTQEKYLNEPVDLLIDDGNGLETLKVDVRNLTRDQSFQAFASDRVRSVAEQRAYLEDRKASQVGLPEEYRLPFKVTSKSLVIFKPCELDRKQLASILAEMS